MLTDDIKKTIKDLKKLNSIESAAQNAERRVKNENDLSDLVSKFTNSTLILSEANKQLGFKPSAETLQNMEEEIQNIEEMISSSYVDEIELEKIKQYFNRKVNPNLSKEWKEFHTKKTARLSAKLFSMEGLVQDRNKIAVIKQNLNKGSNWLELLSKDDGIHTRFDLLTEGIEEVNQLEQVLNLSDEIKDFVVKVTRGRAKVTDLNQNILDWIVNEKLTDKFTISFKNNE